MNSSTRFCDNCGATNRIDARFCYSCGQPQLTYASSATGLLDASHHLKQRYCILEKLGQGGFGAIYKVEDMLFNNAVRAVKEMGMRGLNPQETQEAIAAFKHEAMLLANLSHPNLPCIYDHFEEHGRWYLTMDYIDGETLETRLEHAPDGKLAITEVIALGIQLCTVLGYLHSHQPPIIFRDLKPANVMLTADNHLYLIDFGIARLFKPGQAKDTVNLGTPGYASPEQYGRMQTTIRSDIYSLGATLYHLISGIYPGLTPFLFLPLDLPTQIAGNAALETLIMQMLEMKEAKRPADTQIIKQELQRIEQMRRTKPAVRVSALQPRVIQEVPIQEVPIVTERPPSVIVAQGGGGQYTTISAAMQNAVPNTFILVQPGVYRESLILDRDIEIIGNGPREQIILESSETHCVVMHTNRATLRGLSICCQAGDKSKQYHALDIVQGELFIEDCALTSNSSACIAIHNAATKPTIRYCAIHTGASNGIAIYNHAEAAIEYCDIFQNSQPGISISEGGKPIFRHCTIHDNQSHGVLAYNNAQGTFEDCEFYKNKYTGVTVTTHSNLLLLRCQLHHNQQQGAAILQEGQGSFQDCDIFANVSENVLIASESIPYFYRCSIHDGAQSGVLVKDKGQGVIDYCTISAHPSANISITGAGNPLIQYCTIQHSLQSGIHVYAGGHGSIEDCTITENAGKALDIAAECTVALKRNQI